MNNKVNPIPFSEVKVWIKNQEQVSHPTWGTKTWHPRMFDLIDGCVFFSQDYCKSPYGFAETDNVNDLVQVLNAIQETNIALLTAETKSELSQIIKSEQQKQRERFAQGKNSTQLGRHIGRLHYLLSLES
jgi:hypothetical protein